MHHLEAKQQEAKFKDWKIIFGYYKYLQCIKYTLVISNTIAINLSIVKMAIVVTVIKPNTDSTASISIKCTATGIIFEFYVLVSEWILLLVSLFQYQVVYKNDTPNLALHK